MRGANWRPIRSLAAALRDEERWLLALLEVARFLTVNDGERLA